MVRTLQSHSLIGLNRAARYEELENRYQDLEKLSSMPRTVYEPQEIIVEKPIYTRIGQEVDRLMDMKQSHDTKMVKQLMFYLLFFQGGYSKYMRLAIKCMRELDLDSQILEGIKHGYIDRLWNIYKRVENRIIIYMMGVFEKSLESAPKAKKTPIGNFENNVLALRKLQEDTLYSMLEFYRE